MEIFTRQNITVLACLLSLNAANATQLKINDQSINHHKTLLTSDAIAGGLYLNNVFNTLPLLAVSHDGGTTWSYPSSIISSLPNDVDHQAIFTGARCSQLNCFASGYYLTLLPTGNKITRPLLSYSPDGGDTWSYPTSIISKLPKDFEEGSFAGNAWCSGLNCIAAGKYANTANLELPLIAVSHDGGASWKYPSSVISNLPTNFMNQIAFTADTCQGTTCFATGQYRNTSLTYIPFLAHSTDAGDTWSYPPTVFSNLPSDFSAAGIFNSISCSNLVCVAAGNYSSTVPGNPLYPLIAISNDVGTTWTYPPANSVPLPSDFVSMIAMNSVNCSQNNCVAVGQYQSSQGNQKKFPLLLHSQDSGHTWVYPLTVITKLPADFQNQGLFNEVECDMNTCIAVGNYQSRFYSGQQIPLVTVSLDGGKTWTYPSSIVDNLPTDTSNGQFYSISCNKSDCTAKGQYQSKRAGVTYYPLIATSHDSGLTWTYPSTVKSNLPADYDNNGIFSGGNSSYHLHLSKTK